VQRVERLGGGRGQTLGGAYLVFRESSVLVTMASEINWYADEENFTGVSVPWANQSPNIKLFPINTIFGVGFPGRALGGSSAKTELDR